MTPRFRAPIAPPLAKVPTGGVRFVKPPPPVKPAIAVKPAVAPVVVKPAVVQQEPKAKKQKKLKAKQWRCSVCKTQGAKGVYPPAEWWRLIRQGEAGKGFARFIVLCPAAGCLIEYLHQVEQDRDNDLAHPPSAA